MRLDASSVITGNSSGQKPDQKPKLGRGPGRRFIKGQIPAGATPFKPGVSGNPSGRPKALQDVVELARTHTPAAIAALAEALNNPRERVAAATVLLDRAWGRAPQVITGDEERPIAIAFSWAPATPSETAAPVIDIAASVDDTHSKTLQPLSLAWEAPESC